MQRSLAYRALAKVQTILVNKLMKFSEDPGSFGEDVHLRYYTPAQLEAENSIDSDWMKTLSPRSQKVLVVIPFRDKWELTERCLEGLLTQELDNVQLQVALVDNGSVRPETREGIELAVARFHTKGIRVRHLRYEVPFNFSYLNNQATKDCSDFGADVLALVNNDIEFIETNSLKQLIAATDLPKAGAVGCTLLYPDGLIQHLFVFVGSKIVGSHPYKGKPIQLQARWYQKPRAVGAVTGAVLVVKSEIYKAAAGFDENLPTSYQDVDLCLKLQKMGYTNWVVPNVLMVHHETQTRSHEPSWSEADLMEKKWGDYLLRNPFVSAVWSRKSEHFVFTLRAYINYLLRRLTPSK